MLLVDVSCQLLGETLNLELTDHPWCIYGRKALRGSVCDWVNVASSVKILEMALRLKSFSVGYVPYSQTC